MCKNWHLFSKSFSKSIFFYIFTECILYALLCYFSYFLYVHNSKVTSFLSASKTLPWFHLCILFFKKSHCSLLNDPMPLLCFSSYTSCFRHDPFCWWDFSLKFLASSLNFSVGFLVSILFCAFYTSILFVRYNMFKVNLKEL